MASVPTPASKKCCDLPGCTKPLRARGFCVACYYRLLRHGVILIGSPTQKWKHRLSQIVAEDKRAVCAACGPVNIMRRHGVKPGIKQQWRCGKDAAERSRLYKSAYRMSRKVMLKTGCEVCGNSVGLRWDHNHRTGVFRGTLCNLCNIAIGAMRDDPGRLRAAALYVETR